MTFNKKLLAAAILAQPLIVVPAVAQDEDDFDASIAFGYVGTSGNTDTETYSLEYLMAIRHERWLHNVKFQALGSQENAQAKAERYYLEDKSDFSLDENQYLFVKGSYTDDRFSGFSYQAAVSTGYGRFLIRNDGLELEAFGGAGYRQNDIIDGDNEGEAIFTLGEKLSWDISDNAALTQALTAEIGEERTVSVFEVGLETNIIGGVTTKIAFLARNNSEVPAGRKKTDTLTTVSLVYNF